MAKESSKKRRTKHESLLTESAVVLAPRNDDDDDDDGRVDDDVVEIAPKRKKKRGAKEAVSTKEEEEERALTAEIFGSAFGTDAEKASPNDHGDDETPLFVIDATPSAVVPGSDDDEAKDDDDDGERRDVPGSGVGADRAETDVAPAWVDEDEEDERVRVSLRTNNRTRRLRTSLDEDEIDLEDYAARQRKLFVTNTAADVGWATATSERRRQRDTDDDENEEEEGPKRPTTDDDSDDDDSDDEPTAASLLRSAAPLLATSSSSSAAKATATTKRPPLPPSKIDIFRCLDVNHGLEGRENAVVRTVRFRPTGDDGGDVSLITGGLDRKLHFFSINDADDKTTRKHTVRFHDLPLYRARFVPQRTHLVVCAGRRPFFYLYDAEADRACKLRLPGHVKERSLETFVTDPSGRYLCFLGNDGHLYLWDVRHRRAAGTLKINGSVRCATFTEDGAQLLCSGSDGDVYRFDVAERRCVERFANEDGTVSSALAVGDGFLAVGAESGVVNLYDEDHHHRSAASLDGAPAPAPTQRVDNLRTSCTTVAVHPSSELLCLASRFERNALRLHHRRSGGVFRNWPTAKTPAGYVFDADFDDSGRYLAVGNDKGVCLLYRLNHYCDRRGRLRR